MVTEAYRLAEELIPVVDRMPRGMRSLVGSEIVRDLVGLQTALHEAALHHGRKGALGRADVLGAYERAQHRADEVGKMLGGWLRSERRSCRPSGRGPASPGPEGAC